MGNWEDLSSWLRWDGANWFPAGEAPNQNHDVFIQQGHKITLNQNQEVRNLYLFGAEDAGPKLNLQSYELHVYGALRSFDVEGENFILYGLTSLTEDWIYPETGKIVFKGASRIVVDRESWSASNLRSRFSVIFDPDPGAELVVNAGFKASDFLVKSGTLRQTLNSEGAELSSTFSFNTQDEFGDGDYGNFRVASGATLISEVTGPFGQIVRRSESKPASSFILEEGGKLVLLGAQPEIDAAEVRLEGEVWYASDDAVQNSVQSTLEASQPIEAYHHLYFEGAALKNLPQNFSLTGDMIYLSGGEVVGTLSTMEIIGEVDQELIIPNFEISGVIIDKSDGILGIKNDWRISSLFSQVNGMVDFHGHSLALDFDGSGTYSYSQGFWTNLAHFHYHQLPLIFNGTNSSFPFYDSHLSAPRTVRLNGSLGITGQSISISYQEQPGKGYDPGFHDNDGAAVVYHLYSFFSLTTTGNDLNTVQVWVLADDMILNDIEDLRLVADGEPTLGDHVVAERADGSLWAKREFNFSEAANSLLTLASTSILSVLPLEWTGLKADWTEKGILVSWESGKDEGEWEVTFVLSRALDNGLDFKEVSSVVSNSGKGEFSILDQELPQIFNYIYYRITAYEENGAFYQSPLIRMDYRAISRANPKIFPNPYSGGQLEWVLGDFYSQAHAQVKVFNGLGTRILNGEINTMHSPGDFLFQLQKLPPGLYFVHFYAKSHTSAIRWIKLNY
ncbi:MAG: T9SS type A sorting domain-containing protein [Cyclobacteriaceae bacterium]